MIWASALLVFGTVGVILANLAAGAELLPGFEQMIHARTPWILLGTLWAGCALGVVAVIRRRSWPRYGLLGLEVVLTALLSAYFLVFSMLPPHELAVGVGEPFPGYALLDQDGNLQRIEAGAPRAPALYIFYRGDW